MTGKLKITMLALLCSTLCLAKDYKVSSPDGHITVVMSGDCYSVLYDGTAILKDANASLDLGDKGKISLAGAIRKAKNTGPVKEHIKAPLYRQKEFDFEYNALTVQFKDGNSIEWRVSNEGVAYRFGVAGKATVKDEVADFKFAEDGRCWLAYSTNPKKPEAMAFQNKYTVQKLSDGSTLPAFLPITVEEGPVKVTILESDLKAYPGMFVKASGTSIKGEFAKYPKTFDYYPWRKQKYVTSTEDYIAVIDGARQLPWRIMAITTDDTQMPVNNMVYALAEPSRLNDVSWIHPGFSTWEWWNDWQLTGVDFEAGINMDTYKFYIDFASKNGLEYAILDEGWYDPKEGDMLKPIEALNIEELAKYAVQKNVKLILWCVFNVLDDNLEEVCRHYSNMGIAGFKVDFLDRDDQEGVEMIYRIAETAAKYHLILDYHGIYKPTGINRTFPNIINFEAVFGQEEVRWSEVDINMPEYNVTLPYIRMMSGYTDYTPGAMRNANHGDFHPVYNNSVVMGTRAHQVALYIVLDSPLTMLCDSPTLYMREQETTDFITSLPRIYDEERVLQGKLGEYVVIARRAGENWYIGGLTSWTGRDLNISLDFLGTGTWKAELFRDGRNASRNAEDYKIETFDADKSMIKTVTLSSGGGFAMKLTKN